MTWADLNRVRSSGPPAEVRAYVDQDGSGLLKRGGNVTNCSCRLTP